MPQNVLMISKDVITDQTTQFKMADEISQNFAALLVLTYLPLDNMATVSQMIFSDAFSRVKDFVVWLKFYWSSFLVVQTTIILHWIR